VKSIKDEANSLSVSHDNIALIAWLGYNFLNKFVSNILQNYYYLFFYISLLEVVEAQAL
jgi:hypothetical protein